MLKMIQQAVLCNYANPVTVPLLVSLFLTAEEEEDKAPADEETGKRREMI